jgi:hypothetical protein
MKDIILIELYFDKMLRSFIKKITPQLSEEAHSQFMMNVMVSITEDKLLQMHDDGVLLYYCVRMIRNMVVNQSSPFNKKYSNLISYDASMTENSERTFSEYIEDKDSNVEDKFISNEKQEEINLLLSDVKDWLSNRAKNVEGAYYDEMLFNKYFSGGLTFRDIAAQTGIPLKTIYTDITLTQSAVLTKFQERYDNIINR